MQGVEQAFQRALPALLCCQLLRYCQLFLAPAQWHKVEALRAVHPCTEQTADPQGLRAVQGQGAAAQRAVEQGHQRTVNRRLPGRLRQCLGGQDLALQQGAHGQLLGVEAGQGGDAAAQCLLQADRQVARRRLGHGQLGAQRQGEIAAGLHVGFAATGQGQLEQKLEGQVVLLERQHLGLGALAGSYQALGRLQQLEHFTAHKPLTHTAGGGLWDGWNIHVAFHRNNLSKLPSLA